MRNLEELIPAKVEWQLHEQEELVWLVSLIFTDKFVNKNRDAYSIYDFQKRFTYFADVLNWVNSHKAAKKLLKQIKSEITYTDKDPRPKDENIQKVKSLDFLRWAENKGMQIPKNVIEAATWLIQKERATLEAEKREKENFPELTVDEFKLLQKEPLWRLYKAILYIAGKQSSRSNNQIIQYIKYKEDLSKLSLYITQADKTKKISIFADEVLVFDPLDDPNIPNYKLIEYGSIEPKAFCEWVATLPLNFPILGLETPATKSKSNKQKVDEEKLNPKRKNSLHKLVLTMAMAKYRHDPEALTNSSTKNIKDALNKRGLHVDENTIRSILSEAYRELKNEITWERDENGNIIT